MSDCKYNTVPCKCAGIKHAYGTHTSVIAMVAKGGAGLTVGGIPATCGYVGVCCIPCVLGSLGFNNSTPLVLNTDFTELAQLLTLERAVCAF